MHNCNGGDKTAPPFFNVFCEKPRNPPKFSDKINAFAGVFFVRACKLLIYSEKKFSFFFV